MLESDQDRIFCTHTKVIAQRVVYYHMGNSVFLTDPKHRMDMEDGGISSYTGDFRKKESYIKIKGFVVSHITSCFHKTSSYISYTNETMHTFLSHSDIMCILKCYNLLVAHTLTEMVLNYFTTKEITITFSTDTWLADHPNTAWAFI